MTGRNRRERGAVRLDPRLLIGIVLVAGSTIGVWALVDGLDDTVDVYVARETLTPGAELELDRLDVESVRLGTAEAGYLRVDDTDDGLVVTRTVGKGELVPAAAVGDADATGLSVVVVPSRGTLARGLDAGSRVDVWSARAKDRGGFEAPKVLVADAEIAGIVEDDGMVSSGGASVEVLVPSDRVAAVLEALATGDAIDLVASGSGD
ncbi:hypothetical protein PX701_13760 [Agromyces sp. H3Y2-19a]|jgi:hypothetical protein|uniref:hypothetical protein n=1 Tax=Agromyces TaxID=33877 RepID=UPI001E2AA804|nr:MULTISPECIES: hypothetical protein [Agromyces]MCD5347727.1 hypothetical protein [Agromyces sp. S2-1-8]MDF0514693.1 hypothetical protein [Agromyces chromiiresistens]